jgi:hypothetical protein
MLYRNNLRRNSLIHFLFLFLYIFLRCIRDIILFLAIAPLTLVFNNNHWFTIVFSNHELSVVTNKVVSALNNNPTTTNITDIVDAILDTTPPPVVVNRLLNFSLKDILLFSAVISATDSVAPLTFIKEEQEPKLFAILFGEGVINDAVCIVLYGMLKEFLTSSDEGNIY